MDDALTTILQFAPFDDCQHIALLTRHSSRVVLRRVGKMFTQVDLCSSTSAYTLCSRFQFEALHYQPKERLWSNHLLDGDPLSHQYRRFLRWRRETTYRLRECEFHAALQELSARNMLEYDAMDKSQSRERERILGQFYRERLLSEEKFKEMWEELNEEQSREFWEQMRQRDSRSKHLAREVSKHWMPLYRREETETRRLERVAQSELQLVQAQLPRFRAPRATRPGWSEDYSVLRLVLLALFFLILACSLACLL